MVSPLYPNVPKFPGVPPVFRSAANPVSVGASPSPLTADQISGSTATAAAWGLYRSGGAIALQVDSIVKVAPQREFRVSDYPVEQGGFQSFNKVAMPGDLRVTVTKGGTDSVRQGFLVTLDQLMETTELFNFVTPDSAFLDRSIIHYDYERTNDRGVTLLTIEIELLEIRQTAKSAFTNSKAPSGDGTVQGGPVRPSAPSAAQTPPVPPS